MQNKKWNYFQESEVVGLNLEFVAKLDMARHYSGVPYIITDGLRTGLGRQDRNAVNNSAHLIGKAVDLRCRNSHDLFRILNGLIKVNFNRIGIYFYIKDGKVSPSHIHVDCDETKPPEVVWLTVEL